MRTKSLYDYRGFEGIDASLEISLFEYGVICKHTPKDYPDEYRVIYGVEVDEQGNYNLVDSTWKRESELDNLIQGKEWMSKDAVDSFLRTCGTSLGDWLELSFITKLHDLVSYFGFMDILGSVYYGFEINNN